MMQTQIPSGLQALIQASQVLSSQASPTAPGPQGPQPTVAERVNQQIKQATQPQMPPNVRDIGQQAGIAGQIMAQKQAQQQQTAQNPEAVAQMAAQMLQGKGVAGLPVKMGFKSGGIIGFDDGGKANKGEGVSEEVINSWTAKHGRPPNERELLALSMARGNYDVMPGGALIKKDNSPSTQPSSQSQDRPIFEIPGVKFSPYKLRPELSGVAEQDKKNFQHDVDFVNQLRKDIEGSKGRIATNEARGEFKMGEARRAGLPEMQGLLALEVEKLKNRYGASPVGNDPTIAESQASIPLGEGYTAEDLEAYRKSVPRQNSGIATLVKPASSQVQPAVNQPAEPSAAAPAAPAAQAAPTTAAIAANRPAAPAATAQAAAAASAPGRQAPATPRAAGPQSYADEVKARTEGILSGLTPPTTQSILEQAKKIAPSDVEARVKEHKQLEAERDKLRGGQEELYKQAFENLEKDKEARKQILKSREERDQFNRVMSFFRDLATNGTSYWNVQEGIFARQEADRLADFSHNKSMLELKKAQQAEKVGDVERKMGHLEKYNEWKDKAQFYTLQAADLAVRTQTGTYDKQVGARISAADMLSREKIDKSRASADAKKLEIMSQERKDAGLNSRIMMAQGRLTDAWKVYEKTKEENKLGLSITEEDAKKDPTAKQMRDKALKDLKETYDTVVAPAIETHNRLADEVFGKKNSAPRAAPTNTADPLNIRQTS